MLQLVKFLVILILISSVHLVSIVDENEQGAKSDRVHDHKLSDHDHYTDSEHNLDYDNEAFLGKDEAERLKKATPTERIERLKEIITKIDKDKDGLIDEAELHEWIKNVSKQYIMKDVELRWKFYDTENTGSFNLDTLIDVNYGALQHWTEDEKEAKKAAYDDYMKLMKRDKRRFRLADADNDGKLDRAEYADFLHPEQVLRMREAVIDETIEEIDRNGDGLIDVEEYIVDIFPEKKDGAEEPEWLETERENFAKYRDTNNDGKMDRDEIANWILPVDYDHTLAEAKHLIYEADADKDDKLSRDEILNNSKLFVSSQATGYGDILSTREDL